jgi:hypothetical protein
MCGEASRVVTMEEMPGQRRFNWDESGSDSGSLLLLLHKRERPGDTNAARCAGCRRAAVCDGSGPSPSSKCGTWSVFGSYLIERLRDGKDLSRASRCWCYGIRMRVDLSIVIVCCSRPWQTSSSAPFLKSNPWYHGAPPRQGNGHRSVVASSAGQLVVSSPPLPTAFDDPEPATWLCQPWSWIQLLHCATVSAKIAETSTLKRS